MAQKEQASRPRIWWEGVRSEWRKIVWPTRDDLLKQTTAVVIVSVVLGTIITIIDFLVQNGIDFLIGLA